MYENYKENFRMNIRTLLRENNMSQGDLGKEINKNVSHINGILNGHNNPTLDFVIQCAEYFKVSVDTLLFTNM